MRTLVIIHIGHRWPHYLKNCIHQARLINPVDEADIVLIINCSHYEEAERFKSLYKIKPVYIEDLIATNAHGDFYKHIHNLIDLQFRKQYWLYVVERFFILDEYMLQEKKSNVYMIETDNLLYVSLKEIELTERLFDQEIALPFDSLERGYPSFMFFRTSNSVSNFTQYILTCIKNGISNDMLILGKYRKEFPNKVFSYPVLPHECNTPLKARSSKVGHTANEQEGAFLCDSRFPMIFDAIAYGQAVGGIDPCNTGGLNTVGYVNESALYTIHETVFEWRKYNNIWIPFANNIPIVNLHIHSKALECFLSDKPDIPIANYNSKYLEQSLQDEMR